MLVRKLWICFVLVLPIFCFAGCFKEQRPRQRLYLATSTIQLEPPRLESSISIESALQARRSLRRYDEKMPELQEVGQLLWATQGITENQKKYRTAPSAGALYPLEVYLVAGEIASLPAGIYFFNPIDHSLKLCINGDVRNSLSVAALKQPFLNFAPGAVIITAVFDRTAKRYGENGEKFVFLEAGHAAQNFCLQAEALEMGAVPVGAFDERLMVELMALPVNEKPIYILPFGKKARQEK